jgi:hypothetical protein
MGSHVIGGKKYSIVRTGNVEGLSNVADNGNTADVDELGGDADADDIRTDSADNVVADSGGYIDPTTIGGTDTGNADTGTGKRRGRKPGKRGPNKRTTQAKAPDLVEKILFNIHQMGASFLKIEELAIDKDEAKNLASAVNQVKELYDIPMLDEKTEAWVNLAMPCGFIYGPRIVAHRMNANRKKQESAKRASVTGVDHFQASAGVQQ